MTYNFLVLSVLCCIPGLVFFVLRKDLRPVIVFMALVSIPFGFTESLFYPEYWEPVFLWDLADKIGFGLEDILFVSGLGALTSTIYAVVFRKKFSSVVFTNHKSSLFYAGIVLCVTGVLVFAAVLLHIPMIYGSVVIMLLMSAALLAFRRDLILPSLAGGVLTCAVYTFICIIFSVLFKDVFFLVWHGEKFSNIFIAGVLLEEYLYSFAAGVAGTMFYPFVTGRRFIVQSLQERHGGRTWREPDLPYRV